MFIIGLGGLLSISNLDAEETPAPGGKPEPKIAESKTSLLHDVYADVSYQSKYLGTFGFTISDKPVSQNDFGFSLGRLNYNLWANFDVASGKPNEVDNQLSLSLSTKYVNIQPDVLYFTFPNTQIPDSVTTGIALSSKDLPIDLKLYGVQAFSGISQEGRLYQFTAGKTFKLNEEINMRVYSNVTYNEHYFNKGNGFSHVAGGIDVSYNLGKGFTFTGSVRGQEYIDSLGGTFKDNWVWGLNLNKKFK